MSAQRQFESITEADYYARDAASPTKLEFIGGKIVAMAGGSFQHGLIGANLAIAVGKRLENRRCFPVSADVRVRSQTRGENAYPDLTVVCPPARFDERQSETLINPAVVFEVLSPGTAERDLTTKSDLYFSIPSVSSYVLVTQDRCRVELRARGGDALQTRVLSALDDELELSELDIRVPLREIYARVEFPPALRLVEDEHEA